MTHPVVLYGLVCPGCEVEDELWHDVVRGLVECHACGHRAVVGGEENAYRDEADDEDKADEEAGLDDLV